MPIYEFKCNKCNDVFELLMMKSDDDNIAKCPGCGSEEFERIMSSTNYAIGAGGGSAKSGVSSQSRSCGSGSCTTYTIPGSN